jgi:hypothetical protein
MNRIYGQYSWLNFVQLSKRQIESELVSLAETKLAWGNRKGPDSYNDWVEA